LPFSNDWRIHLKKRNTQMETKHRRIKALIVVVIVGIGMMQNIHWNFEPGITRSYASFDSVSEEETDKAETGFLSSAVLMIKSGISNVVSSLGK